MIDADGTIRLQLPIRYRRPDGVQGVVFDLQQALNTSVVTGQIVLNMNDGRLQSFETKTYAKVATLDKMNGSGAL